MRELGKTNGGNPFIVARNQRRPDTIKNLDATSSSRASCISRTARRAPRERDEIFRQRQGRRAGHLQHPCKRDRRHADGARAGAPARDRRLAGHQEDSRQRHLPARAEPESGRPDHGDRLVQPESRHAVRVEPAARTSTTRTPGTTTTATCTCSRRRKASTWRGSRGTTGSRRCGSTQHQMGSNGARMFVMPATDPINPNVHPLIYRWNAILGQSQAAALEAAGKDGHHLQLDLHELLAGRDGVERLVAQPDRPAHRNRERAHRRAGDAAARAGRPLQSGAARRRARRPDPSSPARRCCRRPTRCRAPSIRGPGWAAAGRCATSSTTS